MNQIKYKVVQFLNHLPALQYQVHTVTCLYYRFRHLTPSTKTMTKKIQHQKNFMNTTITMTVVQHSSSTVAVQQSIEDAFGEFDRIVKAYTRFNENSELSNLNRRQGEPTKVSEEFFMLIKKMFDLHEQTNGIFDPSIIDYLEAYGYDASYDFSKLDDPKLVDRINAISAKRKYWKPVGLDARNLMVTLNSDQRLDLGGIGKGYAIDCAAKKLLEVSEDFLIDGGGDIYAHGKNEEGGPWVAALKTIDADKQEKIMGGMELHNEALASSGSWARKVKQFHHILNPKTGKPVEADYSTVFVKAPTATEADAWATALFVGGRDLECNFSFLFV